MRTTRPMVRTSLDDAYYQHVIVARSIVHSLVHTCMPEHGRVHDSV